MALDEAGASLVFLAGGEGEVPTGRGQEDRAAQHAVPQGWSPPPPVPVDDGSSDEDAPVFPPGTILKSRADEVPASAPAAEPIVEEAAPPLEVTAPGAEEEARLASFAAEANRITEIGATFIEALGEVAADSFKTCVGQIVGQSGAPTALPPVPPVERAAAVAAVLPPRAPPVLPVIDATAYRCLVAMETEGPHAVKVALENVKNEEKKMAPKYKATAESERRLKRRLDDLAMVRSVATKYLGLPEDGGA